MRTFIQLGKSLLVLVVLGFTLAGCEQPELETPEGAMNPPGTVGLEATEEAEEAEEAEVNEAEEAD